nr:unnamed protein product [Digitaria exilis]
MDRRGEASHRGWSSSRGRGWRGRGRSGGGGGRPSPPPPSSPSSAAVNPAPAVTVNDAAPIMGTCPDMCPARERALRERLWDLAVLERVGGDPSRTSPSLAVKKVDSLSLWYGQLATPVRRSKEMIFVRNLLRYYQLGNFKRFFCMITAEATDLQLCLIEPFLNEVRARALMYFNHSGYKLQHHPLDHLSQILMIEESELETLCGICGLEIRTNEGRKAFVPKQASFSIPTSLPQSNGIYISREVEG